VVVLVCALGLVASASAALAGGTPADDEAALGALVNRHRVSSGADALDVSAELTLVARRHAERMAAAQRIWHDPALREQVESVVAGVARLGENVAVAGDVDQAHGALLDSAPHRANIEKPDFRLLAVGAAEGPDGLRYYAQIFVLRDAAPRQAPRSAQAPAAPAPKPPAPAPAAVGLVEPTPGAIAVAAPVVNEPAPSAPATTDARRADAGQPRALTLALGGLGLLAALVVLIGRGPSARSNGTRSPVPARSRRSSGRPAPRRAPGR